MISTEAADPPAGGRRQDKVVTDKQPASSADDEGRREVSAGKNFMIARGSDPYGLLPKWLTMNAVEVPRAPLGASMDKSERVEQREENAVVQAPADSLEGSIAASSERKVDLPEGADAQAAPENATSLADPSTPPEKSKAPEPTLVSSPEPAEPLPPRPKTTSPVAQSAPKPAFSRESQPVARPGEDTGKGSELPPAGALASFVAMRGNDLLKDVPPPERREPQGYITVESKPESIRNPPSRNRSKPPEPRTKTEQDPAESPDSPLKSRDEPSRRGDAPAGPGNESADLQRFALDFVRTDRTSSVAEQHRFYAESVHFYGEGDLSWAGVAAATRRHHEENQNRRFGATAPAVVKGPVDGGFYVVDQPVSWSRTDGSRQAHGRSILRLRVISTGRGGWKITSIEEVGQ